MTFRVTAGVVTDIRLTGLECRVPHPDNPLLALCLQRAPGLLPGTIGVSELAFSKTLGDVVLRGAFVPSGPTASGTWAFTTQCGVVTDEPCAADGEWTATWKEELQPDAGPVDVGSDTGADQGGPDADDAPGSVDVPGVDGGPLGPAAPATASVPQVRAHQLVLDRRQRAGTVPIAMDEALNTAAQAHAAYYNTHVAAYQASGLSPHSENADWAEGFTGTGLSERLAAQGVSGLAVAEVMAFSGSTEGAIDGWMATLYHRIPLIHPSAMSWGYGEVIDSARCEVGDLVYGATGATTPSRWPAVGASEVDVSWSGNENPQPPLPAGESYPSGPIITLTYPDGWGAALSSATLTVTATSVSVPVVVRDPSNDSWLSSTWAIYALDPLAAGTKHTVTFVGNAEGKPVTETWDFTTR